MTSTSVWVRVRRRRQHRINVIIDDIDVDDIVNTYECDGIDDVNITTSTSSRRLRRNKHRRQA